MPKKLEECVESVLEDNPDYSESRAYAICQAQQADIDPEDMAVVELSTLDEMGAEDFDELATSGTGWVCQESDDTTVWMDAGPYSRGAVVYQETDADGQQTDGFGVDVYRIVQTDDEGPATEGDILGVAVDMPNAGVYVDWNIDAWPDDEQLSEAHVSDYGNIGDLAQVTQGELEPIETVETQSEGGVLISGLSSEALDSIRSKYNAAVKQL